MGNVNLPTPVAVAGAALCVLGGYLLGAVTATDGSTRTTATVESYDQGSSRLCLTGDQVTDQDGVENGVLCGTWRRTEGSPTPREGDLFRFVSMSFARGDGSTDAPPVTVIYGDVVG